MIFSADQTLFPVCQTTRRTTLVRHQTKCGFRPCSPTGETKKMKAVGAVNQKIAAPTFLDLLSRTPRTDHRHLPDPHDMHTPVRALTWPNRTASCACFMCCALFGPRCVRSCSNNGRANRSQSNWEHGFFRHKRRREGAIIVCEQARYEAAQEGIDTIDTLHDAANAFASTTPAACADTTSLHASPRRPSDARSRLTTSVKRMYRCQGGRWNGSLQPHPRPT